MNKHGQTLVAFIIIIPIILLALGSIIELSVLEYNKKKIESTTKTIIASHIDSMDEDKIRQDFEDNDIVGNIQISTKEGLEISVDTFVQGYLGKIIDKENYEIKVDIIGYQDEGKIKFKKGA